MKNNTFMREYFRAHYEDPTYDLTESNQECRLAKKVRTDREEAFTQMLKEKAPELYIAFDDLIGEYLTFENLMFEEFYILGVQDRDRALMSQR